MLTDYIRAAMQRATYKTYPDGTLFGEIPGLQGVWATGPTQDACRDELQEALEDWITVGLYLHHPLPVIDDIDLNVKEQI
ncbi:MAG: type II toxin-antitoxin system HicB family antitoxin [Anaerolineae bacterium]